MAHRTRADWANNASDLFSCEDEVDETVRHLMGEHVKEQANVNGAESCGSLSETRLL